MNDLTIRQVKNTIIDYLNNQYMPIEVKRLIVSEICVEFNRAADNEIRKQIKEKEENEHAESVQQNSMGEQTERSNAAE